MKPRVERKIQGTGETIKGGDKKTIALIRWRLIGERPSDELIREITGLEPDDPHLDECLAILDILPATEGGLCLHDIFLKITNQ